MSTNLKKTSDIQINIEEEITIGPSSSDPCKVTVQASAFSYNSLASIPNSLTNVLDQNQHVSL